MLQATSFIINLFCTGVVVLFFFIGLLFYILRRPLGTVREMQKQFGKVLMLLALHILFIQFEEAYPLDKSILFYIGLALVVFDVFCVSFAFIPAFKWFINQNDATADNKEEKAVEEKKAVIAEEPKQEQAEVTVEETTETPAAESSNEAEEQDTTAKEEETEESEDSSLDNEDNTDEAENVTQLESTRIEDLIFFQKVEALMAQKRLFCESEISRDMIASEIGTNRTYLARSIKNATGKTFLEYITDLRTSYAATLLTTTNEPLDMIGVLVGFRSKSAYYRAFSAAFNCSPSEYKKRSLNKE